MIIKQQRSRILISYPWGVYTWLVPLFYKTIDCKDVLFQEEVIQQNFLTVIFYIVTIYDAIGSTRSSHFQAQLFHLNTVLQKEISKQLEKLAVKYLAILSWIGNVIHLIIKEIDTNSFCSIVTIYVQTDRNSIGKENT